MSKNLDYVKAYRDFQALRGYDFSLRQAVADYSLIQAKDSDLATSTGKRVYKDMFGGLPGREGWPKAVGYFWYKEKPVEVFRFESDGMLAFQSMGCIGFTYVEETNPDDWGQEVVR